MMARVGGLLTAAVLLIGAASVPAAQMISGPASKQLETAILHAKNAAGSSSTTQIELHLHHVVNCIEGQDGKNYFKASGDVCEGMGRGLFRDLQAEGMAGGHALPYVEIANSVAQWGLAQGMRKDVARAKAAAEIAQAALVRAKANFK